MSTWPIRAIGRSPLAGGQRQRRCVRPSARDQLARVPDDLSGDLAHDLDAGRAGGEVAGRGLGADERGQLIDHDGGAAAQLRQQRGGGFGRRESGMPAILPRDRQPRQPGQAAACNLRSLATLRPARHPPDAAATQEQRSSPSARRDCWCWCPARAASCRHCSTRARIPASARRSWPWARTGTAPAASTGRWRPACRPSSGGWRTRPTEPPGTRR